MPRQFFTLKSILTAPPGTFGNSNGLGGGSSTTNSAILEEGHGSGMGVGNLALSDDSVIEIDDVEESYGSPHDEEYEEEIEGAPPTADEEVLYQDEPDHDDDEVEVRQAVPQQVQEYIQQMQQQMQMMAQQLQYHQQQEHERQQQLAQRQEPEMAPPVARFANYIVYDGTFEPLQNQVGQILSEAINEVMRLRARAAEAFERKAEEMLADLAMSVLGRELRMAPAD
jgi:hypothetical protein